MDTAIAEFESLVNSSSGKTEIFGGENGNGLRALLIQVVVKQDKGVTQTDTV